MSLTYSHCLRHDSVVCSAHSDVNKVQEGIGDKIGNFFQWFSTFITGLTIGFVFGWKLALVIMAVSPLLVASGVIFTKVSAFCRPRGHTHKSICLTLSCNQMQHPRLFAVTMS